MKRVFSHIGFSVAVTLFALCFIKVDYIYSIAAGLTVLLIVSLAISKYRQAIAVPLCLSSAVFACLLFLFVFSLKAAPALSLDGKEADFTFYITALPQFDGERYIYTVKTSKIMLDGAPDAIRLRLYSKSIINVEPYTLISANGKFRAIADNAFSSYGYWSDGIFVNANIKSFNSIDKSVFSPLKYVLNLRNDIIETFMKTVKGDEGALSAALVTGDRYYISKALSDAFRYSGASHILAVSGLHLSVVTGGIYFFLKHSGLNRKVYCSISMLITVLYMALTDFSSSVVRAGIMMITVFFADFFKRKADSLNSLGLALFIICLNPFAISDAGTILSVLSVLALVIYYPYLDSKLFCKVGDYLRIKNDTFADYFRISAYGVYQSVLASISILTFNLPALYLLFGYTSLVTIVSNVVVLPLGSIVTVVSFLTYLLCKFNFFGNIAIIICTTLNKIMIGFVSSMSEARGLTVAFSPYFAVILAAILIVVAVSLIIWKGRMIKTVIAFSYTVLIISLAFNLISQYNNADVLITENGACAVAFEGKTAVYGADSKSDYYSLRSFINTHGGKIDLLIDGDDSGYCEMLDNDFEVTKRAKGNISCVLNENFSIDYTGDRLIVSANGKSVYIGNDSTDSDIIVSGGKVYDKNGIVYLEDGDVIYSINRNDFSVRR